MAHDESSIGPPASHAADLSRSRDAIDALNRQSRILQEAWMLPRDRSLTDDELDSLCQGFVAYLKANEKTVARVAEQIGYSASTLSEWVSGKYAGDASAVARKVNDWMERDSRRVKAKRPAGYIPTQVAEDMRSIILAADKAGMMAAIVAPSGCGKTFVLESLVETLNAVYVRCDDTCSPRGLLRRLAKAMGEKHRGGGTRAQLQEWVIERLAAKRQAVFLDEAHQLNAAAISLARTLHDEAKATVILCGTVAILESINDRFDGRGQFCRRCIRHNVLDYVRDVGDPRAGGRGRIVADRDLFSLEEVRKFFELKRIKLHKDALQMLWLVACLPNYGTLGFIEKLACIAIDLSSEETPLDRPTLIAAMSTVMGEEWRMLQQQMKQHFEASTSKRPAEVAVSA